MNECELRFQLIYRPAIAGGRGYRSEHFPLWLQIFMSHELRPRTPLTLSYSADNDELMSDDDVVKPRSVSIPLRGKSSESAVYAPLRDAGGYRSFSEVGRQFAVGRASRSCCLIINAYASTVAEDENRVQSRVGTARVNMTELLELLRASSDGEEQSFRVIQNTNNAEEPIGKRGPRADEALNKGSVTLSQVRVYDSDGRRLPADEFARRMLLPAQPIDNETDAQRLRIAEVLRDVVIRSLTAFTHRQGPALLPTPTKHFLGHFHCPEWRMSFMFAPAFAYLAYRSEFPTARSFFVEATRTALRRCALDVEDAISYTDTLLREGARSQRQHAVLRMLVMIITLYATTMPYLDDFVNANRANGDSSSYSESRIEITEDFKCARLCGADDCEGVSQEALLEACDLVERLERSNGTPIDILLGLLAQVLRCYVPCLSLHAVTNKKNVPAARLDVADDNVPAHTICVLIPFKQFERWVANDIDSSTLRKTRYFRTRADTILSAPNTLPLLIVDGTARTDPTVLPLSEYFSPDERARGVYGRALSHLHDKCLLVEKIRSICTGTRITSELFASEAELTPAHRARGDSSAASADISDFYKYSVKVQTLATAELGMCDFALVVRPTEHDRSSNNNNNARGTYGVYFNDFITQSDRIALVPYLHVTQLEMAHLDMLLASEEFVPSLVTTPLAVDANSDSPLIDPRLLALRRGSARTARVDEATILHPRTVVLAARTVDIDENEIQAFQRVCTLPNISRVDVDVFRVVDAVAQIGEPLDVIDVTIYY